MAMIGAKTITSIVLFIITTVIVWVRGHLSITYLARLDPLVTTLLGVFSVLAGTAVVRIWGLDEKSSASFRYTIRDRRFETDITLISYPLGKITVAENTNKPLFDFPPALQRGVYIVIFLWIGLIAFNNRNVALLKDLPNRIHFATSRFCEDQDPKDDLQGPVAQGCELVMRAYRLGYAKSLGPCAPKAPERSEQPCTLRQRDEPYLHFAWRLLVDRTKPVLGVLNLSAFREFKDRLQTQLDHLSALYDAQRQAVTNTPRASHHLWTNLPHPRRGKWGRFKDSLEPGHCVAQASRAHDELNTLSGAATTSDLLERVFGQLLFDPRYRPIVGVCAEYTIHWNAPRQACSQLARQPRAFLAEAGALEPVLRVLARHQRELELGRLRQPHADRSTTEADPIHERIISFHCFIEGPEAAGRVTDHAFTLAGHRFRASEIGYTDSNQSQWRPAQLAQRLATLLARGFHYGRLMSRASPTPRKEDIPFNELFADDAFLLAKLEYLRDADLFLTREGLGERIDLYEVYPYHLHLRNFVEVFRRHYKLQRGRL